MTGTTVETTMLDAAAQMIAVLEAENAALAALDLRGATALLDRKRDAAALLDRARRAPAAADGRAAVARLRELADKNKALLDRAMTAQERVLSLVVRAVNPPPQAARYGARGTLARGGGGFALAASA